MYYRILQKRKYEGQQMIMKNEHTIIDVPLPDAAPAAPDIQRDKARACRVAP
jgi:hypothetical protein